MNRETIVDTPGLLLWYYPDTKIIHHEMQKYPGAEVLESALEKGLEVLRTRGAHKWLSDDRKGGALPKSHHEWGNKVWGPAAAAAGWLGRLSRGYRATLFAPRKLSIHWSRIRLRPVPSSPWSRHWARGTASAMLVGALASRVPRPVV
jgi:hypothetical protein